MSKNRYAKKKGKGGQKNPKKKWTDLKVRQREQAIQIAAHLYRQKRVEYKRPLTKQEKYSLIKGVKLPFWIPKSEIQQRFMNEFSHQENLIVRDQQRSDADE